MHIDRRLETIANLVPQGCVLADIGTDHAYLPVWLLDKQRIARAIAGDIAAGPCQAARTTVAQFGQHEHVEVRQGSGLKVLSPGEADCIAIAGMGASTIISILEDDTEVAQSAELLVLQPMAGAASLRAWLCSHGWQLAAEELVDDAPHFYEIIAAKRGLAPVYRAAECAVGPCCSHRSIRCWVNSWNASLLPADSCWRIWDAASAHARAKSIRKSKR